MPKITVTNTGGAFECGPQERILDAALRQGVHLPHNCRGGACGACKAKVLEGQVDQGWVMSFGISDEETEAGLRLLCMSTPASDAVTVQVFGEMQALAADPIPGAWSAQLVGREAVGQNVRRLTLDVGESFAFVRGQHVELGEEAGDGGRPYSVAEAPDPRGFARGGLLHVYVARYEDGVTSRWLCDEARLGDNLTLRGPYGCFGRRISGQNLLLVGGGTGFSPLYSIAQGLLENGHAGDVRFVLSARRREDLVDLGSLVRLQRTHPNFSWTATLTRDLGHRWLSGRLTAHLASGLIACDGTTHVLIAGPPAFADDCAAAARMAGVAECAIEVESYTSRRATISNAVRASDELLRQDHGRSPDAA